LARGGGRAAAGRRGMTLAGLAKKQANPGLPHSAPMSRDNF
jgi:hypothetical protein